MIRSHLDHLVITAPSLAAGVDFVRSSLGVEMQPGGEHPRMGTHNALLKLGEALYLEVLAANSNAPQPDRPRWFGLDALAPSAAPRLAAWVVRTNEIRTAVKFSPVPPGMVETMSRGSFQWEITIPEGGSLLLDGAAPLLIQWQTPIHPAATLPERGCALVRLEIRHPQATAIQAYLDSIGFSNSRLCSIEAGEAPILAAQIQTPTGIRAVTSQKS